MRYALGVAVASLVFPILASAQSVCPTLQLGSTGAEVLALQKFLTTQYVEFKLTTGYYGTVTQAAVTQWQGEHGIAKVGYVGPITAKAMGLCSSTSLTTNTVSPATSPSARTLVKGMSGSDVTALQQFLVSQNLLASNWVTGYFGANTENAVKKFQVAKSVLSPRVAGYGTVGPRTRATIESDKMISTIPITSGIPPPVPITPPVLISPAKTLFSCTIDGKQLQSGQSATFYSASSIESPKSCSSIAQTRTCTDNKLSGSSEYSYATCSQTQPPSDKGSVISVTVTNPGGGCTGTPNVDITGDGTGAYAIAWLKPTTVASIQIDSGGHNFGGGGQTDIVIQGHNNGPGSISTDAIVSGGVITGAAPFTSTSGWVWTPAVSDVDSTGRGDGAFGHMRAILAPTGVDHIDVVGNGGENYTNASVTVSGAGCTGVVATAKIVARNQLPSWWSSQNWLPAIHPAISGQYIPANIPGYITQGESGNGLHPHNVLHTDANPELSAMKFAVVSRTTDPVISFTRAPHDDCNCYRAGDKILSMFLGGGALNNIVWSPGTPFPSALKVMNGSSFIAEFNQGIRLLGGGQISGPGPGGIAANDVYSYLTTDSASPGSGAMVTQGGLGVGKSANVGGSVSAGATRAQTICVGQTCITEADLDRIIKKLSH